MCPIMSDARAAGQVAVTRCAEQAGRVRDDGGGDSSTGDLAEPSAGARGVPMDDEVLEVGRQWVAPAWLGRPTRYLRRYAGLVGRVPPGARWALVGAAVIALLGLGAVRPTAHPAGRPAPSPPSAPSGPVAALPTRGTASHYPGLLQEYDEQRAALRPATPRARHFGHRLR
jgi:hypothetical protein